MASVLLYIVLALVTVTLYLINYINKKVAYFKRKGVPQPEPEFFYGNGKNVLQRKVNQGEFIKDVYNKFKKEGVKHGGVCIGLRPTWIPLDPGLIKTILIKDFTHFSAHIEKFTGNPFFNNLFAMDGEEWKDMRKKLTPTFTSGKMKMMFNILLEKMDGLADLVDEVCKTGKPTEIKKLIARCTTDIVGSCGFGVECNSMKDINSEFFRQGQKFFNENSNWSIFQLILIFTGLRKLGPPADLEDLEQFFSKVVSDTINYREKNKIVRKDFLHLMIQLKNKGVVTELTNENEDIFKKTVDKEVMSLKEIAAQCLLFFNAGYETSSTTLSFALLELTQNQDVQTKIREEVREVLKRHNGKLSYDALQEMKYCDNVIKETLRKHPAVPSLPRLCTKNYTIPGSDIVIEKGTTVQIPVWGLQMDPDYFPDPEKFIPDRFNEENKSQIKDFTYLPFGEGPRMCLGLRFGMMQSKAGLVTLINKYNFTLDKKTPYPPIYKKSIRPILSVETGVWVNATKVD